MWLHVAQISKGAETRKGRGEQNNIHGYLQSIDWYMHCIVSSRSQSITPSKYLILPNLKSFPPSITSTLRDACTIAANTISNKDSDLNLAERYRSSISRPQRSRSFLQYGRKQIELSKRGEPSKTCQGAWCSQLGWRKHNLNPDCWQTSEQRRRIMNG